VQDGKTILETISEGLGEFEEPVFYLKADETFRGPFGFVWSANISISGMRE
jgi:hypothetical protein